MGKYMLSKTLAKAGIVLAEVLIAGTLAYIAGHQELIFLAPVFEMFLDWLKHKDM